MKWSAQHMMVHCQLNQTQVRVRGRGQVWVPARPVNLTSIWQRLRHAWGVLRGRLDVVEWDGQ